METHYLELMGSIAATAVVSITAGWKLLDLRFYKFQGQLIEKLNGMYIRRNECDLSHDRTTEKLDLLRIDVGRLLVKARRSEGGLDETS